MTVRRRTWQKPHSVTEATRRWGKSGTVSINAQRLGLELGVLMTFEKAGIQNFTDTSGYGPRSTSGRVVRSLSQVYGIQFEDIDGKPIGVRFSGHPDALLAMFRALHIAYAERRSGFRKSEEPRKRTIILDGEGGEHEPDRAAPDEGVRPAHDILPAMRQRRK